MRYFTGWNNSNIDGYVKIYNDPVLIVFLEWIFYKISGDRPYLFCIAFL
jgi:hypothetical protein